MIFAVTRLRSQEPLFRTEVAEIISRQDQDAIAERAFLQFRDAWQELEKIERLHHQIGTIGGATERGHDLHLPAFELLGEQDLVERLELVEAKRSKQEKLEKREKRKKRR